MGESRGLLYAISSANGLLDLAELLADLHQAHRLDLVSEPYELPHLISFNLLLNVSFECQKVYTRIKFWNSAVVVVRVSTVLKP